MPVPVSVWCQGHQTKQEVARVSPVPAQPSTKGTCRSRRETFEMERTGKAWADCQPQMPLDKQGSTVLCVLECERSLPRHLKMAPPQAFAPHPGQSHAGIACWTVLTVHGCPLVDKKPSLFSLVLRTCEPLKEPNPKPLSPQHACQTFHGMRAILGMV